MGQGLHTKLAQICAHELQIPVENVHVVGVTSHSSPNSPGTGGSMGTDIHGPAVIEACGKLVATLKPFTADPVTGASLTTVQACGIAAKMGANLVAMGSFKFQPWAANPLADHNFLYWTWNAACVQVELDVLTGEWKLQQADVLQDVGKSLSPSLDIGQVEGAFVQGSSWLTLEDLESCYAPDGTLDLTPETLEIFGARNMPSVFKVALYKGDNVLNPQAPHGSKGIGEPPYSLGITTALALRHAVASARVENGHSPWATNVTFPLTPARLQQMCGHVSK